MKSDNEIINLSSIPKIIHYCWFGEGKIQKNTLKYIETWKKFFPDYTIIKWDETNFPIHEFKFAQDAYKYKKYAFVSDVARIYALYKFGGIYFDTDVEVIRDFADLVNCNKAVLGIETYAEKTIGTGFMAMPLNHPIAYNMLNYYKTNQFLRENGEINYYPNTHILWDILLESYKIKDVNEIQNFYDLILYPQEYFTAYNGYTGRNEITNNTYCVHHFSATWIDPMHKIKLFIRKRLNRIKAFFK